MEDFKFITLRTIFFQIISLLLMFTLVIMILLLIKKDKRIKLDYIIQVSVSPLIGSIMIVIYCKIVGLFILNLWCKTVICVVGSVILYGVVLIGMKNDLCLEIIKELKERRRKIC